MSTGADPKQTLEAAAPETAEVLTPLYAAVDIGSGSVRLNLFGKDSTGKLKRIEIKTEEMSRKCDLAKGLSEKNLVIKESHLNKAITILRSFDVILKKLDIKPENICAIATEAVRAVEHTKKGKEDIARLIDAFGGREIKIAQKTEEALLIGEAIKLGINGWNVVKNKVIDIVFASIGGGSLETGVLNAKGEIENLTTLPYGVLRLEESSGHSIPKAGKILEKALNEYYRKTRCEVLVVMGGNWRTLGKAICGHAPTMLEGKEIPTKLRSATHWAEETYRKMGGDMAKRAPHMRLAAAMLRRMADHFMARHFHTKKVVFIKTTMRDAMAEIMHRRDQGEAIPPGLQRLFSPSALALALPA